MKYYDLFEGLLIQDARQLIQISGAGEKDKIYQDVGTLYPSGYMMPIVYTQLVGRFSFFIFLYNAVR